MYGSSEVCRLRLDVLGCSARGPARTFSGPDKGLSGQGAVVCKLCVTHQVLITCKMLCATWDDGTAPLLSLAELKSHL